LNSKYWTLLDSNWWPSDHQSSALPTRKLSDHALHQFRTFLIYSVP
jgi:hypothetical protein